MDMDLHLHLHLGWYFEGFLFIMIMLYELWDNACERLSGA
jgi:hypothetical protein